MKKLKIEDEWDFVIKETHKRNSNNHLVKREMLFMMQIFLSKKNFDLYQKTKKQYCYL